MTKERNIENFIETAKVIDKELMLRAYSYDAGFYIYKPEAVIIPESENDIVNIFKWCTNNKKNLAFRAAGTSLSGQAHTNGLLLDISRSWKSFKLDVCNRNVIVQPGVRCGKINDLLRKHSLKIGPDPASVNSCLFGGLLANNSSGMRSGIDKNPYNTIKSIRFILPSGHIIDTADSNANEILKEKAPEIFNGLLEIKEEIESNSALKTKIANKYSIKNTIGYSINSFLDFSEPVDILAHLMIGSEGTLGFISEAELKLFIDEPYKFTGLLLFSGIREACNSVETLKNSEAVVIEFMDYNSLFSVSKHLGGICNFDSLPAGTTAILFEYEFSDKEELEYQVSLKKQIIKQFNLISEPVFAKNPYERNLLWTVRQGLLPSLATTRDAGTTVIIEDVAFHQEDLADGILDLQVLLKKHKFLKTGIYGHAIDGNVHFMLAKSFETPESIKKYDDFANELAALVVDRYNGSLKAEHGTGRNMAPFVEKEWGQEAYNIMKRIKKLIDPDNILNPGVVISDDKKIHLKNIKSLPAVDEIIDKCMECGFCEPKCPSRKLTLSPRQRIILARELVRIDKSEPEIHKQIRRNYQYYGMDTCAVDGLCASVCPAGINTGELVKNLRYIKHTPFLKKLANLAGRYFNLAEAFAKFGIRAAHFFNNLLGTDKLNKIISFVGKTTGSNLPKWNKYLGRPLKNKNLGITLHFKDKIRAYKKLVYFPCCMTRMLGRPNDKNVPSVPEMMHQIAGEAGYKLVVPSNASKYCCGMVFSSKGYKEAFINTVNKIIPKLWEDSDFGHLPVVFDASSCAYTIKTCEEYLSEENKNKWKQIKFVDINEFIHDFIIPEIRTKKLNERAVLHPNCSVQKMGLAEKMKAIAENCAEEVFIPNNLGCCGFAGDRGLLFPELNLSASANEAKEVSDEHGSLLNGYYSSNLTCETGMSTATGKEYYSILYLLYKSIKN